MAKIYEEKTYIRIIDCEYCPYIKTYPDEYKTQYCGAFGEVHSVDNLHELSLNQSLPHIPKWCPLEDEAPDETVYIVANIDEKGIGHIIEATKDYDLATRLKKEFSKIMKKDQRVIIKETPLQKPIELNLPNNVDEEKEEEPKQKKVYVLYWRSCVKDEIIGVYLNKEEALSDYAKYKNEWELKTTDFIYYYEEDLIQ